jgi:kynureninase
VTTAPGAVAEPLLGDPNPLARYYARFRVAERLLLTGHSHQAWPDVARAAMLEAFDDAAAAVDAKWERAAVRADEVSAGYGRLLGEPGAAIALGASTHELVVRFLSALDLRRRPRLLTTDGEFHTLRRQLARLGEAGLAVERVATEPVDTLAARLARAVDDRTAAVLVSAVLFETARIVPGLEQVSAACARHGAELLVDAYHALGPLVFELGERGLADAWVTGGGYKYLQLGEGVCFLRLPAHAAAMRPVLTGWFAEFGSLADEHDPDRVVYGDGAVRFAGSTYDPVSHYRATAVLRFFAREGLTPARLQALYQGQLALLAERFDALDLPPALVDRDRAAPLEAFAGFLALRTPHAAELQRRLAARGVLTDSRADRLRLGPAPYLGAAQLTEAMERLGATADGLG